MGRFQRRQVLAGLLGAGSATFVPPLFSASKPLRVGVVGGGIVGAAIAMYLARGGANVVLFEKTGPGLGATQNSFAWVNAFVDDVHYRALRIQSLLAYRVLDRKLALKLVWGGYLNWAADAKDADIVRSNARQLEGTPYPVRDISAAELARLDPNVSPGPVTDAFYSTIDAHLDPVFVTRRFLETATAARARIIYPCELSSIEVVSNRLRSVATDHGRFELDRLVVAAGVDTPRVLAMVGYPLTLKHAPGILAHSRSLPGLTRRVHDAPGGISFKQMSDGSVVGTDAPNPPDIAAHQEIRSHTQDFPSEELRNYHGNRILKRIARFLPAAEGVPLERLTLGFRPLPTDEFPIMGRLPDIPDIHVAVTHSGVTLAPVVGRLTAEEVLTGSRAEIFSPYRPERFAT